MEIRKDPIEGREYFLSDIHNSRVYIIGKSDDYLITEPFKGVIRNVDYRVWNRITESYIGEFPILQDAIDFYTLKKTQKPVEDV